MGDVSHSFWAKPTPPSYFLLSSKRKGLLYVLFSLLLQVLVAAVAAEISLARLKGISLFSGPIILLLPPSPLGGGPRGETELFCWIRPPPLQIKEYLLSSHGARRHTKKELEIYGRSRTLRTKKILCIYSSPLFCKEYIFFPILFFLPPSTATLASRCNWRKTFVSASLPSLSSKVVPKSFLQWVCFPPFLLSVSVSFFPHREFWTWPSFPLPPPPPPPPPCRKDEDEEIKRTQRFSLFSAILLFLPLLISREA